MKQIVDKLNKIAKKIDENVDIPNTDLITDSLDAITTALGGTPNDSNLIVDKLEDIAGVAHGGGGGGVSNPVIEVTFINNTGHSNGPLLYVFDENDNEMKWVQFNFANGATEVVNTVVIPSSFDGPEGPFSYFEDVYLYDTTITASDAVNCTFGEESIRVTDPTQNGSITLTLS